MSDGFTITGHGAGGGKHQGGLQRVEVDVTPGTSPVAKQAVWIRTESKLNKHCPEFYHLLNWSVEVNRKP